MWMFLLISIEWKRNNKKKYSNKSFIHVNNIGSITTSSVGENILMSLEIFMRSPIIYGDRDT